MYLETVDSAIWKPSFSNSPATPPSGTTRRSGLEPGRDRSPRDRPISPRSPWQNPYAERLIGTIRRDCLDHVLIFGERHLRRVLTLYSRYYNETRTHLGLGKDAPLGRAV
jgi:transposase InsO family protein